MNTKRFVFVYLILSLLLTSCSVFRSLGLYNIAPDYADTYEEITGKKFIPHSNSADNLKMILTTSKKEYSPYEDIEFILTIFNSSRTDTVYICPPGISLYRTDDWARPEFVDIWRGNEKLDLIGLTNADYAFMLDDYDRKISPLLIDRNCKISPGDSLVIIADRRIGNNLLYQIKMFKNEIVKRTFNYRENFRGVHDAYYKQTHEEYDQITGPKIKQLVTPVIKYTVRDYTPEELFMREKTIQFVSELDTCNYKCEADSMYSLFMDNYGETIYSSFAKDFYELYIKYNDSLK